MKTKPPKKSATKTAKTREQLSKVTLQVGFAGASAGKLVASVKKLKTAANEFNAAVVNLSVASQVIEDNTLALPTKPVRVVPLDSKLKPLTTSGSATPAAFYLPQFNITLLNEKFGNKTTNHRDAEAIVAKLSEEKRLGCGDWKLCEVDPLFNLCDRTQKEVITVALRGLIDKTWYWTSTLDPSVPEDGAFIVIFGGGTALRYFRRSDGARVLACRVGGPASPSQ